MALKGERMSEETKRKIGLSNKGHSVSDETKRKISERTKASMTPEICKAIGDRCRGKKLPDDHRKKIADNHVSGENHPHWNGGSSFKPYCPKFSKQFKERVRKFFGYICVECGNPQNGKKLDIHHVNFNKMSCCDDTLPLFVSLCRSCHAKTGMNRGYWEEHFTSMITEKYEGKCY